MKSPAFRALTGALVLIIGAAEGPTVVRTTRAWLATRSWPATRDAINETLARVGTSLNWSRPALIAAVAVLALSVVGAIYLFHRQPRELAAEPVVGANRRGHVVRLARMGGTVAEIARETRMAQDAVRGMLAAR